MKWATGKIKYNILLKYRVEEIFGGITLLDTNDWGCNDGGCNDGGCNDSVPAAEAKKLLMPAKTHDLHFLKSEWFEPNEYQEWSDCACVQS